MRCFCNPGPGYLEHTTFDDLVTALHCKCLRMTYWCRSRPRAGGAIRVLGLVVGLLPYQLKARGSASRRLGLKHWGSLSVFVLPTCAVGEQLDPLSMSGGNRRMVARGAATGRLANRWSPVGRGIPRRRLGRPWVRPGRRPSPRPPPPGPRPVDSAGPAAPVGSAAAVGSAPRPAHARATRGRGRG